MTISAHEGLGSSDFLDRNIELYRDLSVALQDRITHLKGRGEAVDPKDSVDALKAHHRALQTVLDLEASLVKRNRCWTDGGGGELDLAAARAEILARLAAWAESR